jgi:fucose 4-O-acetylase-like acetyltransferase
MQPTKPIRYHAFDSLRGSMMLLGVLLHSICAYSNVPGVWAYKDLQTSTALDLTMGFLHTFRLPVFFVMAGFFAALLYERRGPVLMMRNRALRVLVPLVAGSIVLWVILEPLGVYADFIHESATPLAATITWLRENSIWDGFHLMHLWFLDVLFLLYVVNLLVVPLCRRSGLGNWLNSLGRRVFRSRLAVPAWALAAAFPMALMPLGVLETPYDLLPPLRVLVFYYVFFTFGWWLWSNTDLIPDFQRGFARRLGIGMLLVIPNLSLAMAQFEETINWAGAPLVTALTGSFTAWFMMYGLTGLFLRYLSREDARARYLSDSSYWLYLAHPVVLLLIQFSIAPLAWPAEIKAAIGFLIATPILLLTYNCWVRPTWLGWLLNGRRYPRYTPGGSQKGQTLNARASLKARCEEI